MAMDLGFDSHDYDKFALYDPSFFVEENISDEIFNLFYAIDRTLFYRLVRKLGRNVDESMFAVAFLIWLERIRYSRNAVYKVIGWPFHLVDRLAKEIAGFLTWLREGRILGQESIHLSLLQTLCPREINLLLFHEKRVKILENVSKIISEVCTRAFRDILTSDSQFVDAEGDRMWRAYNINPVMVPPPFLYHRALGRGFPPLGFRGNLGSRSLIMVPRNSMGPNYHVRNVLENSNADLSEMFGGIQLVNGCEDEPHVDPDDRTIFLTFSKGYFIPESDIREFFTRIFGDFIEEIHMQDVTSDEQPLFARLVCRSSSIIPHVAPLGIKTKYSINGKQVWAKKYVRRGRASTSE